MSDALRVDVLLHRLCITRSRSEAKTACEAGAVFVNGLPARPSQTVAPGQVLTIRFPQHTRELEVLQLPGKSVSKKAARDLYRVLREEKVPRDAV